ncbi:MAG: radical SAM family heme chaperone HemW [Oscillospiraceae bacterium]|nr:radical SAM family heme chaperone HemW [Oscillospiraceae bacterium]
MKTLGIYIHIPFCAKKCAYCDFYSLPGKTQHMPRYAHAVIEHIKESSRQLSGYYIDTVYFGGGTPSYFGADRLIDIFEALKQNGQVLIDSEVTLEANPDSTSKADLIKLRKAGFNRISFGVQDTDDESLKKLGRLHTFAAAREAVENARDAGFKNISIDLMYGLPSQTKESWAATLAKALTLKPDHISCYGLKLAPGTEMYIYNNSPFIPDDDTQADMYLYAVEYLERFGYRQYEISNFSKKGYESAHNLKYWTGQEYLGFGAAAYSYIGGMRFGNIADIDGYTTNIVSGEKVIEQIEKINAFEKASEYLMLGLRTTRGICESEYRAIYPADFSLIQEKLKICEKHGWAVNVNDRWNFTPQGFLLSNILIGQILDVQSEQGYVTARPWKSEEDLEKIKHEVLHQRDLGEETIFHGV